MRYNIYTYTDTNPFIYKTSNETFRAFSRFSKTSHGDHLTSNRTLKCSLFPNSKVDYKQIVEREVYYACKLISSYNILFNNTRIKSMSILLIPIKIKKKQRSIDFRAFIVRLLKIFKGRRIKKWTGKTFLDTRRLIRDSRFYAPRENGQ